jgi:hypothetical protein
MDDGITAKVPVLIGRGIRGIIQIDADIKQILPDAKTLVEGGVFDDALGSKKWLGPLMVFADTEAGKPCQNGKGERVWVAFRNLFAVRQAGMTQQATEKTLEEVRPEFRMRTWQWDWQDYPQLTTKQTEFADQPGFPGGPNVKAFRYQGTVLIGVACRSTNKKTKDCFAKELLDAGTVLFDVEWDGKSALVSALPNAQYAGQNVQGDLLRNGKWIQIMNKRAKGVDKLEDCEK